MPTATEGPLAEGYQLRLPSFEGPLDVLLRLIEREQLAITDVSLLAVTRQFLDHIAALPSDDPAVVADFSAVASRLLLLKSRSLLPRPPAAEEETIGDLAEELIARRDVQRAAHHLQRRLAADVATYARAAEAGHGREQLPPPKLAAHPPTLLVGAIRRRLSVIVPTATRVAVRRVVPIGELIERTLRLLGRERSIRFDEVARTCRDADEVRASFLAVLVLARRRLVEADQAVLFGPITLRRADDPTTWPTSATLDALDEQPAPS